MKKFTLLAVAALSLGTALGQNVLEIKTSDENTPAGERTYYRMRNMRAMRLNYTNKVVLGQNGDSIGYDNGCFTMDSVLLDANNQPVENPDGTFKSVPLTCGVDGNAYMGLSELQKNWWLSFSAQEEVKSPHTEYWWFEEAGKRYPDAVLIHNAVIEGTVSNKAKQANDLAGWSRSNMDFSKKSTNNRYYILPVRPAFEKISEEGSENWIDSILGRNGESEYSLKPSITEDELNSAFALCTHENITVKGEPLFEGASENNDGDCLDMNNYINYKIRVPKVDENGDPETDDNGDPTYYQYGFAGVDRTWTPITTNGVNNNHWVNNGTLFFFEEAPVEDALEAIEAYAQIVAETYQDAAKSQAKEEFAGNTAIMKGWRNIPAIWTESKKEALQELIRQNESWDGEGLESEFATVKDAEGRDAYVEQAKVISDKYLAQAAAIVGVGAKVRLQNMLAFRDHADYLEKVVTGANEIDQLGNAYIAAGGVMYYRDGQGVWDVEDDDLTGITPLLDGQRDPLTLWELIPVANTPYFLLYNAETETYIRKYEDMFEYCGGEEMFESDPIEITWATTSEISEAAPFLFYGCPSDEDPYQATLDSVGEDGTNVEAENYLNVIDPEQQSVVNKARLEAYWTKKTTNELGVTTTEDFVARIHRGTSGSKYQFINYTYTKNTWLADTNAFEVVFEEEGVYAGISEVAADAPKTETGIYDLQGRKVAKAGKGLYIINGVKTLVK